MRIVNHKDFVSGAMYGCVGIATAIGATQYSFGTTSAMGPGYFPFGAGVALAIIGVIVIAGSISPGATATRLGDWDLPKVGIIVAALLLFAVTLSPLGLVTALPLLVGISSLAHPESTWRGTVGAIAVLLPLIWLIFIRLLGVSIPLLPYFLR